MTDPCPRLPGFDWPAYFALSEEEQDRYVGLRDAAHEANLGRCEGRKDDAVAVGADANRRLREASPPPPRRGLFRWR